MDQSGHCGHSVPPGVASKFVTGTAQCRISGDVLRESTRTGSSDNLLLGGSTMTTRPDVARDCVEPAAVTAPEGSLLAPPRQYSAPSATGLLRRCLQQIERDGPRE
jgi:hypothetical protein